MKKRFLLLLKACIPYAKKKFGIDAFSSNRYWRERYVSGGNSGAGSYTHLAGFKADVLNRFVVEHSIQSVIEFGCGDGNQLKLAVYPEYSGYDISPAAVAICRRIFRDDASKRFKLLEDYDGSKADLSMSLDVIFHLVEDDVFNQYMDRLFDASSRYVSIYSSNTDENPPDRVVHVKHRKFTEWVDANRPEWKLTGFVPNKYPYNGDHTQTSFADFYFYVRQ